jgi:cytochrome P450
VFHLLETGSNVERIFFSGDLAIVAGSETTASVIKNVLYFLMTNPTAYKRLRTEIDGLGDNIVDCAAQVHLPYLDAVL